MNLFEREAQAPLADRVRPKKLEDVVGQEHIIGQNQFLRKLVDSGQLTSMILWGPPGSGKTTIARILANYSGTAFVELSAVTSGLADVKKVVADAKRRKSLGEQTLLFVDEIHRFNKAQQDAFLPHVESGTIILIGATTENPSFEVIAPLLSRSRVVVLEALSEEQLAEIITRAAKHMDRKIDKDAVMLLARLAAGDARVALNGLDAAAKLGPGSIKSEDLKQALQKVGLKYDKNGEHHYNFISAYIKSMRGSDVDAALFYLAKMLESGEDPKFIARRLVIFASEDIGLADNSMLTLSVATFQAVERIGLPECQLNLAQTTVALAKAPKSRAAYDAIGRAKQAVAENPNAVPPIHLRNAPTKLMKDIGYGQGTQWKAGFKHPKGFLPDELKGQRFF